MKKLVTICSLLMLVSAAPVLAQENTEAKKQKNMFASVAFTDKILGENFIGGAVSFGYYSSPKSLFTAEFNAGFYDAGKIGSYSYGYYPPYNQYTDGEVTYQFISYEILASWYYVGNISGKFQYRVGPSAGVLIVTGEDDYDPTEKNGNEIRGIPDSTTETKATVTGGLGAGIMWNFHERFFFDFGYRILINAGIDFDETVDVLGEDVKIKQEFDTVENQFSLAFGFRF